MKTSKAIKQNWKPLVKVTAVKISANNIKGSVVKTSTKPSRMVIA